MTVVAEWNAFSKFLVVIYTKHIIVFSIGVFFFMRHELTLRGQQSDVVSHIMKLFAYMLGWTPRTQGFGSCRRI